MDRLATIPNAISVLRGLAIPWFVYLVYGAKDLSGAAYLLAVLGSTDWIDGYIARRWNQVSTFGKVADPTVDRVLLAVAAVVLIDKNAFPIWFGAVALGREALVILVGVIIYSMGARRIDVQFIGKAGAMGLMMSLPLFLVSVSGVTWHHEARFFAYFCGIPGLVFNWLSIFGYYGLGKKALAEGRTEKAAAQ